MHDLLELKGRFFQRENNSKFGNPNLKNDKKVAYEDIEKISMSISNIFYCQKNNNLVKNILFTVYYDRIVAKSNRIKELFVKKTIEDSNDFIVGAKFNKFNHHAITYYLPPDYLLNTIDKLRKLACLVKEKYPDGVTKQKIDELYQNKDSFSSDDFSLCKFIKLIVELSFIDEIIMEDHRDLEIADQSFVSVYKTERNIRELCNELGINILPNMIVDETSAILDKEQFNILKDKAGFLISMNVDDFYQYTNEKSVSISSERITIPDPSNEPIVGVIDTMFDPRVYFSQWVQYKDMVDKNIPRDQEDMIHGTQVSSIIVDGPAFNPDLQDNCGRFRVRHFAVATCRRCSSVMIIKKIKEIISQNKDIKVWNLSLGSQNEIEKNFVSYEASELDKIQAENDVIFIIAGTNNPSENNQKMKIGAPADSINSIVVNSVEFESHRPCRYHRCGPVLGFFLKPDVSYYGGDEGHGICVCSPHGQTFVQGASFAAPWITRKIAYMIYVLQMPRQLAKALIIDAASGWNSPKTRDEIISIGYGIVPIDIQDVVYCKDDEIRFFLSNTLEKYQSCTYELPIPLDDNDHHPYVARATSCFFPQCSRSQGVDYTNTELDLQFGRVSQGRNKNDELKIKSIDNNVQTEQNCYITEKDARSYWRKWDSVKHISESCDDLTKKRAKRKTNDNGFWGLKVCVRDRLPNHCHDKYAHFYVVVTLKAIDGIDRWKKFINNCTFNSWLVNYVNIDNMVKVYQKANKNINFDK